MTNDMADDGVRYLDLHGDSVAYRDAGSGEVLLLIHGMAGSSESWGSVPSLLAKNYRVIAPDLLGHGLSAKPRTDYSLGAFAAGLRDLLDELGIREATIVGHSLGGGVAMQFMYQHPEYCRRLILISSGGLGPDVGLILRLLSAPGAEMLMPLIAPPPVLGIGNTVRSCMGAMGFRSPRGAEMWRTYSALADGPTRQAFSRTLRSVVDYRGQTVSALSRLRVRSEVPTLLIWGAKDQIIPIEHGYEAQAACAGSHLEVLPEVGHFPQMEAPAKVADIIAGFITDNAPRTRCADPETLPTKDTQAVPEGQNITGKLKALVDRQATINRAAGMLSSRADLSIEDALERLRELSATAGIELHVAAQRLTADLIRESTRC